MGTVEQVRGVCQTAVPVQLDKNMEVQHHKERWESQHQQSKTWGLIVLCISTGNQKCKSALRTKNCQGLHMLTWLSFTLLRKQLHSNHQFHSQSSTYRPIKCQCGKKRKLKVNSKYYLIILSVHLCRRIRNHSRLLRSFFRVRRARKWQLARRKKLTKKHNCSNKNKKERITQWKLRRLYSMNLGRC